MYFLSCLIKKIYEKFHKNSDNSLIIHNFVPKYITRYPK